MDNLHDHHYYTRVLNGLRSQEYVAQWSELWNWERELPLSVANIVMTDLFVVYHHLKESEMAKAKTKETAMETTVKVLNPNQPHADWVAEISVLENAINLRDFRDAGGKDKRVYLFEGSRRLSEALHSKLLDVNLQKIGDANINHYKMTDEARAFWKNGREEGHSNQQILEGWNALVSMMDDTKSKDE